MKRAWIKMVLLAPLLLSGCKGFWNPAGSGFTLSNSGALNVSPGATSGNTATITVTPSSSFTGTVDLTCAVTAPSGAASPVTCSLSPTSVTISTSTAQTATLTASTTSTTTTGNYEITMTGTSGSATAATAVCVTVGTSSGTCSSASASGNFYVLSGTSISGYSIQAGSVKAISNSSYSNFTAASAIAIAPSGNFLYVATGSGIFLYTINSSTGALSQAQGDPVSSDPLAAAIQVDPSGKWLLDASATGSLSAIPIASSGAQDTSRTSQSQPLAGTAVRGGIAISPNGALVAVALGSAGTQAFPLNAADSISPIGNPYSPITKPYGSAGAAVAVAIDPLSRLLYIGETVAFPSSTTNSGALRVFAMASNSLKEFTYTNSTPYAPVGTGPHAILPVSTGGFVYVAGWQGGSAGAITGYTVGTSALTQLPDTSATGTLPNGLAQDNSKNFVLAVSDSGTTLSAYTFDSATGQLSSPLTNSSVSNPIAIVAAP